MTERPAGTRTQEHEIIIDAPIEAVWKAISEGEELTRWFVEAARVEPGVGGKFWISWGGAEEGESRIEVWEPNQKLRLALKPMDMGTAKSGTAMINEYTLERRDGKTVLRFVHSGIPDSPDWDGFYDGTNSGWPSFFRAMRHYLEHHAGQPRTVVKIVGKLSGSLEDGWQQLTGPGGFGFQPITGQTFSTRTSAGDPLHGEVVFAQAPGQLELSIAELDDAFFAHSMASAGTSQFVYSVLSLYGKSQAEVDAIREKWEPWLKAVLGVDSVPA